MFRQIYCNGRVDGMSEESAGILRHTCFSLPEGKNTKPKCNGYIRQKKNCGSANARKGMGAGRGRRIPVNEAFRCHGANLLPFTKFIGNGLFIK